MGCVIFGCGGEEGGGENTPVDGVTVSPTMEKMKAEMMKNYRGKAKGPVTPRGG
jgi:hypothetical protein